MEKPHILHLFTPGTQASPFDVNMAYDAGYGAVVPYTQVALEQIAPLTQDAIFSRGPKGVRRTGIFIGGREAGLAADMLDAARKAMVPPFEVSVLVDPSGAFTTAAAMVAAVEKHLHKAQGANLNGKTVMVFGGSGPVGGAAAVLAAQAGATVQIVGRDAARAHAAAQECNRRYATHVGSAGASDDSQKKTLMQKADIVLVATKAGSRVLDRAALDASSRLLVAADVNAVPPSGIEGVDAMDDGKPLAAESGKALGIGALAIGNIKYQTQRGLLEAMLKADKALYLNLQDAYREARKHAGL
jgi:methylene-tetrahydromethanopterin dehydrogenase